MNRRSILDSALAVGLVVCWAHVAFAPLLQAATPSSGCDLIAPGEPGETYVVRMQAGGLARSARVHLPPSYTSKQAHPLILSIHGYTGSAEFSESAWTGMNEQADREGTIVVYPQSTSFEVAAPASTSGVASGRRPSSITSWNDQACNASPGPAGATCAADADRYPCPPECGECMPCNWCSCHDDVGFIATLLDRLEASICIDRDRIFAVGFSNGGMFTQRLGCALGHRFAAVAPWAGTLARGFNCAPQEATSLLLLSGTSDRTVPHDGSRSSDGYFYTPNVEVAGSWAAAQGCSAEATELETPWDGVGDLRCSEHSNCASGASVVNCLWRGAHNWPRVDRTTAEFATDAGDRAAGLTKAFGNELLWWFLERTASERHLQRDPPED